MLVAKAELNRRAGRTTRQQPACALRCESVRTGMQQFSLSKPDRARQPHPPPRTKPANERPRRPEAGDLRTAKRCPRPRACARTDLLPPGTVAVGDTAASNAPTPAWPPSTRGDQDKRFTVPVGQSPPGSRSGAPAARGGGGVVTV